MFLVMSPRYFIPHVPSNTSSNISQNTVSSLHLHCNYHILITINSCLEMFSYIGGIVLQGVNWVYSFHVCLSLFIYDRAHIVCLLKCKYIQTIFFFKQNPPYLKTIQISSCGLEGSTSSGSHLPLCLTSPCSPPLSLICVHTVLQLLFKHARHVFHLKVFTSFFFLPDILFILMADFLIYVRSLFNCHLLSEATLTTLLKF